MTIRNRLIISHSLVFAVPLVMIFTLLFLTFAGIWLFTQSGNHVYVESQSQFNHATEAVHHFVFRSLRKGREDPGHYRWIIEMLSPNQSYVVLEKDGQRFYTYGNNDLETLRQAIPLQAHQQQLDKKHKAVYVQALDRNYTYYEKQVISGHLYNLYIICQYQHHADDLAEHVTQTLIILLCILFCLILAVTVFFLTRFVLRYLQRPLKLLQHDSEAVRNGKLDQQLVYQEKDEFTPLIETFNLMTRALQQSLQDRNREEENRRELIASMSHDIRTPLTAIRAYIDGLIDGIANTPAKQQHYLQVVQKKTREMERMINELFLFSKIDLGEKALPLQPMELNQFLQEMYLENEAGWQKQGARVKLLLCASPLPFLGNRELCQRILANLIGNSIKYKTQAIVNLQIKTSKENDFAKLVLTDDGPGVAPADLAKLTQPFYRTDKARSHTENGSGMGLAIVQRGLQLLRARIHFFLVQPHGLGAVIEIPFEEEDDE